MISASIVSVTLKLLKEFLRSDAINGPNSPLMALLMAPTIPQARIACLFEASDVVTASALNEPGPLDLTRDQMKRPRQAKGMVNAFNVMSHRS